MRLPPQSVGWLYFSPLPPLSSSKPRHVIRIHANCAPRGPFPFFYFFTLPGSIDRPDTGNDLGRSFFFQKRSRTPDPPLAFFHYPRSEFRGRGPPIFFPVAPEKYFSLSSFRLSFFSLLLVSNQFFSKQCRRSFYTIDSCFFFAPLAFPFSFAS